MPRILVVEDDPDIAELIQRYLERAGHTVERLASGGPVLPRLRSDPPDLVVLDLMLPELDGLTICQAMRSNPPTATLPIIMLTARSDEADRVNGLEMGADDYLTKPFEFDELVARVRALLRRGQAAESSTLKFEDVEMDLVARKVTRGDDRIKLTPKEFSLLEYFMRNPNRVLTRTAIGEHVWDMNFDTESNVIDVYVSMLRRKIDRGAERPLIHTVIGVGYVLSADKPGE